MILNISTLNLTQLNDLYKKYIIYRSLIIIIKNSLKKVPSKSFN